MKRSFPALAAVCLTFAMAVSGTAFLAPLAAQETETPEATAETAQEKEASSTNLMSPELLWKMGRLGETAVSADGNKVAYTVRRYELDKNKGKSSLHMIDREANSDSVVLKDWSSIGSLQFAKFGDDEKLCFIGMEPANEDEEEDEDAEAATPQAYTLEMGSTSPTKITSVEDGIANLKVAPTGTHIAFTVDVKMDETVNELYDDLPEADARIIDGLMYRHWNQWHDYKYSHLHVAKIGDDGMAGEAKDIMKDIKADCPVPPFGGSEQFNWSPDAKELAFTMKDVENWASSTDSDVYLYSTEKDEPARNLTVGMKGYDNDPKYSPDGKYLLFHSMQRPGFESDKNRVMVVERATGTLREATAGLDQTAHGATWSPDSKSVVFVSEHRGTNQVFSVNLDSPGAKKLSDGQFNYGLISIMPDGKSALVSKMSMIRPKELAVLNFEDGKVTDISTINDDIYSDLSLPKVEERWVNATDGQRIHCWVIYPPNFDKSKKYPMLTYFQGGPQGQIGQWFSYRWNFHLMAAHGYIIVAPNRRGLPGFGRAWNDQISKDWGGQCMRDILSANDAMIREPYVDENRVAGIGASFGGYTAFWMMGNAGERFKTLIAHCGVFNLESMYGSTEELFFVDFDLGGPYWSNPQVQNDYHRFSPHRFIGNWKTPLLIIHGEKDFRVPITQGMEAFTAAQVQGIPSRFLYYPNEGHWVMSPQNGVLWHRVFFEWLERYCKPEVPGK